MFDFYPEVGLSREELLAKIAAQVKDSRFQHILGVEQAAIELAQRYGANPHKASLAGLLHDYAKNQSDVVFLDLIDKYGLNPELKRWGNNVWHGMVGIYKMKEDFDLSDAEILRAVEIHTVGSSEMSVLDKVVYVADYIEAGRDFAGVDEARAIAAKSLDAAVAFETVRTVEFLAAKRIAIYPQTIETYNAFLPYLAEGNV
ncbi:bis(5'-nucleosyl)-tetraphosphatase (symmetrical) YqeK [Lactococcus nasutitermitis]|uniref:bis(5'-nucleosyl)-tetraphosphatase (symmetrical) n=1 Tax=Lactococcus nasutitermitis TaxID=1652957 RepID=A0ABV9JEA5_9LACT|nr:bis(5'-nucleosyl)-tetraphosphatase (symmetrical) YqeK [Lactococcus nasutitermitis]